MSTWKEEIQDRFAAHSERKQEIHKAFVQILQELNGSPRCNLEISDDENLIWAVTIGDKCVQLSSKDVDDFQHEVDDIGHKKPERTIPVAEAIKALLLYKFNWVH